MGLSAFTSAPAGTIGWSTTNWNSWQEVAGLPAPRYVLTAGVLNGALYAADGDLKEKIYGDLTVFIS